MKVFTLLNDSDQGLTTPISAERAKNPQTVMEFLEIHPKTAQRYIRIIGYDVEDWGLKLQYHKTNGKSQLLINDDYIYNLPTHRYLEFKNAIKWLMENDSCNHNTMIIEAPTGDLKKQIDHLDKKIEEAYNAALLIDFKRLTQMEASPITSQINDFKDMWSEKIVTKH